MLKSHFIQKAFIFFLCIVILTGCGSTVSATSKPTPTPTLKPTPTPIPMVKITVQLVDVLCSHKQNALGFHDQFYMMSTFTTPGKKAIDRFNTQSQLSKSIDITDGQDLELPQDHLLVFDGVVLQHASLQGGFTAYNDKSGLDWSHINYWTASIAKSVGDKLMEGSEESDNSRMIVAAAVIDLAVNAWYALSRLNQDNSNQLGKQALTISADGPSSQDGVLHFYHDGGFMNISLWEYTIKYHITRTIITA